jgi:hypothetical protein
MLPPLYTAPIYTHPMPPIRHRPSKETIVQEAITAYRTGHYGTSIKAAISYPFERQVVSNVINKTLANKEP